MEMTKASILASSQVMLLKSSRNWKEDLANFARPANTPRPRHRGQNVRNRALSQNLGDSETIDGEFYWAVGRPKRPGLGASVPFSAQAPVTKGRLAMCARLSVLLIPTVVLCAGILAGVLGSGVRAQNELADPVKQVSKALPWQRALTGDAAQ